MADAKAEKVNGIRLRAVSTILVLIVVVLSFVLLWLANVTSKTQESAREDEYTMAVCIQDCETLMRASDYLTDAARSYVVTGNTQFINNFFQESDVTMRREKALEEIRKYYGEGEISSYLSTALEESRRLMESEYYAMRLKLESVGANVSFYPEELQSVELTEWDSSLDSEAKDAMAMDMLFNSGYHASKLAISNNVSKCMEAITAETLQSQESSSARLERLLGAQYVFIVLLLLTVLTLLAILFPLVVRPMERAVQSIKKAEKLPNKGAYEFRYLASTYNEIYDRIKKQSTELKYEVDHDALTGLYNRGAFTRFTTELTGSPYTLILVDIDNFKGVNDTYGHDVGDVVLKRLARGLCDIFREEDVVFRIGGDEFAVLLKTSEPMLHNAIPDKVNYLNKILSLGGNRRGNSFPGFTISAGAAFALPTEDPDTVFKHADLALYTIKRGTRKGVAFYEDEEVTNG